MKYTIVQLGWDGIPVSVIAHVRIGRVHFHVHKWPYACIVFPEA